MFKVGFIGLGAMGVHMASHIAKAGYPITVYDHHEENMARIAALGGTTATTAKEVAAASEVIITMLPNSPQVECAVYGKDGILEEAKPGTVLIDMSSIDPCVSQKICADLREREMDMLDAPVSGGVIGAEKAILSIMVGGSEELFSKMEQFLHVMGRNVVYCGQIGAGNTAKLANQVIVAANLCGMGEAMVLAKKAGVDGERVFQAIRGGLAGSTVMEQKMPMILGGQFISGGYLKHHIKDLQNALNTAHTVGAAAPITAMMLEIMQHQRAMGEERHDHCCVVRYFEELAGVVVRYEEEKN